MSLSERNDWTRPQALAIPKEGYFKLEQGKYGPVFPRTPACHGFTIIAKIKPGREQVIREYGETLEKSLRVLKHGGRLISLSGPPDPDFAKGIASTWILRLSARDASPNSLD